MLRSTGNAPICCITLAALCGATLLAVTCPTRPFPQVADADGDGDSNGDDAPAQPVEPLLV